MILIFNSLFLNININYFSVPQPELETGRAFQAGFGLKFEKIFGPISGPYAKFFHSRLIKSCLGNLNFGPKSGYQIDVGFGPGSGLTIGPVSNSVPNPSTLKLCFLEHHKTNK